MLRPSCFFLRRWGLIAPTYRRSLKPASAAEESFSRSAAFCLRVREQRIPSRYPDNITYNPRFCPVRFGAPIPIWRRGPQAKESIHVSPFVFMPGIPLAVSHAGKGSAKLAAGSKIRGTEILEQRRRIAAPAKRDPAGCESQGQRERK